MSRPPEWTYPQHLSFPRVSGDGPRGRRSLSSSPGFPRVSGDESPV